MAMVLKRVSVLTIVKNRSVHLTHLVEGLRRSDIVPFELIVVDMSDQPVEIAYTAYSIRILRLETENLPLARARNLAAAHASGDILLFLDVDCIPQHALIGLVINVFNKNDGIVCADVKYLGPHDINNDWTEENLLFLGKSHPARQFPEHGIRIETNPGLFWSLLFGIRRETFEDLKGFDEEFAGYGAEDTDFGFKARKAAVPLIFTGGSGAFHQYHDVYDPPLQHFDDILRNARTFYGKWRVWPMNGWLKAFETMGLIQIVDYSLNRIRPPTQAELDAARV